MSEICGIDTTATIKDKKNEAVADMADAVTGAVGACTAVFIHPSSFVDEGVEIGSGTKIWHFSHIQSGAKIGENCSLGQNVNVGNNVRIGNNCRIQNNVSLYEGVELEDFVFCGPSCVFTNVTTPRVKYPVHGHYKKTVIESGASLGANCTIVCGHRVGKNALIAAGAVVARDVPAHALMIGVPAKQKGWVCECGQILPTSLSSSINTVKNAGDVTEDIECPACGKQYELVEGQLQEKIKGSTPPPQNP